MAALHIVETDEETGVVVGDVDAVGAEGEVVGNKSNYWNACKIRQRYPGVKE